MLRPIVFLASLATILAAVPAAWAATIVVTTSEDELNSDGDCALREAIDAANRDVAVDACHAGDGADTIEVPAGTFTLTIEGRADDANASGDLDITGDLTIHGAGADLTTLEACAPTP